MSNLNHIALNNLPNHIAIIMDGNGRWAKKKGFLRAFGHENGTKSVRTTVEACAKLGVKNLTLYAFSTENWNRPKLEVETLMKLLVSSLRNELPTLQKNNIRLNSIGNLSLLPSSIQKELDDVISKTKNIQPARSDAVAAFVSHNGFRPVNISETLKIPATKTIIGKSHENTDKTKLRKLFNNFDCTSPK